MRRNDILKEYEEILEIIIDFFEDENKAVRWMSFRNPLLGDQSPAEMIVVGRSEKLRKFICNSLAENAA